MRTLTRDKKPLYVCKRIPNSDPRQFENPVKRLLNTVATVSETDMVVFGDSYKEYRRATVPLSELEYYNEGDRVYMYVEPPVVPDPLCDTCDFEITSVSDSITQGVVLFKRLQIGKD